jgi:hypothetical protein
MTFQDWLVETITLDDLRLLLHGWAPTTFDDDVDGVWLRAWLQTRPADHQVFTLLSMVYGDDYHHHLARLARPRRQITTRRSVSHRVTHLVDGEYQH